MDGESEHVRIMQKGANSVQYILPVRAVIEIMKQHPEVVMLQSSLSSLPGVSKDVCLAQIILGQGKVHSCTITSKGAVLRERQAAIALLERCGDLTWDVLPYTLQDTDISHLPPPRRPKLRVSVTPQILARLSHPARRVLLLVDGQRSVEEIALIASKEAEEVREMLHAMNALVDL
jgi:hypothetical protein